MYIIRNSQNRSLLENGSKWRMSFVGLKREALSSTSNKKQNKYLEEKKN